MACMIRDNTLDKYPWGVYTYNSKNIREVPMENKKCPMCHESKHRDEDEKQSLINRLRRIKNVRDVSRNTSSEKGSGKSCK